MEFNYFNLSGGINMASTKTELGASNKVLYWTDAENIEIYDNRGISKQKGNTILLTIPEAEKIIAMHEMESDDKYKLIIVTDSGKIYVYKEEENETVLLNKTLTGRSVKFQNFLKGVLISTEYDPMFYIKDNDDFDICDCNLKDRSGHTVFPECISVFKGRVWCAKDSTIYYSALGSYNDFSTENDAGYINDFHTDTSDITGIHTYKDYLAIYKSERVYLLSGSNPDDFAIIPFADKGTCANKSIVNVDNKQYFLSNGIFALEQVGELNQIRLGSEISLNIRPEFDKFDTSVLKNTFVLHYQKRNQMWFFFPYKNEEFYNTVWINDYVNRAWYKRKIPQNITTAVLFHSKILTADSTGCIYQEDEGTTFNGEAIKFMWKSPFLALGDIHHKKIIEEFYFILDDTYNNDFNFSVYKDYDGRFSDGSEHIFSRHYNQLVWSGNEVSDDLVYRWPSSSSTVPVWAVSPDLIERADIFGSCYSVLLCVEGSQLSNDLAIIGLQFREIYNDD